MGSFESSSDTELSLDGAGFTLTVTVVQGNTIQTTLRNRSGMKIVAPVSRAGSGSLTDTNGNTVSVNSASPTTFSDTLNTNPVLTVTDTGSPLTSRKYSFPGPNGTTSSVTVAYASYSIQTNFQCSGIMEVTNQPAQLVDTITMPDGTFYKFQYEATPGVPGKVTGRLLSVKLPTGGTITYGYYGNSGGINCADGTGMTTIRGTSDGNWSWVRNSDGSITRADPANNQTKFIFLGGTYEIYRAVYQGSIAGGNVLQIVNTCYRSGSTQCSMTPGTSPITQMEVTTTLKGGVSAQTTASYNSYGLVTEVDQSDYATGAPYPLLKKTLTSYNTSLVNGILDRPTVIQYLNGSGVLLSQTSFSYDEGTLASGAAPANTRGNLTTVSSGRGGNVLTKKYTYFDNGLVQTAIDVNNAATTYSYGACGNSLLSSIAYPAVAERKQSLGLCGRRADFEYRCQWAGLADRLLGPMVAASH